MALYETTFFSRQKTQSMALQPLRSKINEQLARLRSVVAFGGETPIVSMQAKTAIRAACGNPHTANLHVYETPISGHWRIFFAQGQSGGVVVLGVGHLNGNVLEQP
ncbi:MAG TPA: hypothetical protein VFK82_11630 [Burkholderiaceae bacterium]|nr:hypothetical protein [Burkholderiaceae bacterium]